jgi:hypothetical protein
MITADDFAAWSENPVTKWVAAAYRKQADALKADWVALSWDQGCTDRERLIAMKAQAEAFEVIADPSFASVAEMHGEEVADG